MLLNLKQMYCQLVEIVLAKNKLSGTLPSALGRLRHLQHLVLRQNRFSGDNLKVVRCAKHAGPGQIENLINKKPAGDPGKFM